MIRIADLSGLPRYFKWEFVRDYHGFMIENWIKTREWVWDCDQGGECTKFWVIVEDGCRPRLWRSNHSWYWIDYGTETAEVINDFEIFRVAKDDLDKYEGKSEVRRLMLLGTILTNYGFPIRK